MLQNLASKKIKIIRFAKILLLLLCLNGLFVSVNHTLKPYFVELWNKQIRGDLFAKWCLPAGECLKLKVADDEEKIRTGLMNIEKLNPGEGMIFLFSPPRSVGFWMYNMLVSLDMIFIMEGNIIHIEKNIKPCIASHCPSYGPEQIVDMVIELAAGETDRLDINIGDRADIIDY